MATMDKQKPGCKLFTGLMRAPDRIPVFLAEIGNEWQKCPDMRFGQMMYSFFHEYGDPFYLEEEEFLSKFKIYINDKATPHK